MPPCPLGLSQVSSLGRGEPRGSSSMASLSLMSLTRARVSGPRRAGLRKRRQEPGSSQLAGELVTWHGTPVTATPDTLGAISSSFCPLVVCLARPQQGAVCLSCLPRGLPRHTACERASDSSLWDWGGQAPSPTFGRSVAPSWLRPSLCSISGPLTLAFAFRLPAESGVPLPSAPSWKPLHDF